MHIDLRLVPSLDHVHLRWRSLTNETIECNMEIEIQLEPNVFQIGWFHPNVSSVYYTYNSTCWRMVSAALSFDEIQFAIFFTVLFKNWDFKEQMLSHPKWSWISLIPSEKKKKRFGGCKLANPERNSTPTKPNPVMFSGSRLICLLVQ